MFSQPPDWRKRLQPDFLQKAFKSEALNDLIKQAEKKYVDWNTFKHYQIPKDFNPETAWAYLKFNRFSNREKTLVKSMVNDSFTYIITKTMYKRLSFIDSNTSGFLSSDITRPTEIQKSKLIISGLTEEAIASSQIEGANTSRKVAKKMLLSKRKARSRDEQMIINNYQVMQRLLEWKELPLSVGVIQEIQKNITVETLEDKDDEARLRTDEDNIGVVNKLTGEVVFTPPKQSVVLQELERLVEYANQKETDDSYVHPVIKASILHFWLAYLHPFVDGNGRTARAIFYWYLLKNNYWVFQYLSVSRIIKKSKKQYDDSFLFTEIDDNDLTYFLFYKLKAIMLSIKDFTEHYKNKIQNEKNIENLSTRLTGFNQRQISLLQYCNLNQETTIDILTHQSKHRVAYQTARTDLLNLVKKGHFSLMKKGLKFIFVPSPSKIKQLFK